MSYTPTEDELARLGRYVTYASRKMREDGDLASAFVHFPSTADEEVWDKVAAGKLWPDEETRRFMEWRMGWEPGSMAWVARGGEPTPVGGDPSHREWLVKIVIERRIETPTSADAIQEICGPIEGAFPDTEVGIVEAHATNMKIIKMRDNPPPPQEHP